MSECPKGKWGKNPPCEDVGVCHNGTLINPRLQKQKNHCATVTQVIDYVQIKISVLQKILEEYVSRINVVVLLVFQFMKI